VVSFGDEQATGFVVGPGGQVVNAGGVGGPVGAVPAGDGPVGVQFHQLAELAIDALFRVGHAGMKQRREQKPQNEWEQVSQSQVATAIFKGNGLVMEGTTVLCFEKRS